MPVFGVAHASKAVIPRDSQGQWAERISTAVTGAQNDTLLVTAYRTPPTNSADLNRYSLVGPHPDILPFHQVNDA